MSRSYESSTYLSIGVVSCINPLRLRSRQLPVYSGLRMKGLGCGLGGRIVIDLHDASAPASYQYLGCKFHVEKLIYANALIPCASTNPAYFHAPVLFLRRFHGAHGKAPSGCKPDGAFSWAGLRFELGHFFGQNPKGEIDSDVLVNALHFAS